MWIRVPARVRCARVSRVCTVPAPRLPPVSFCGAPRGAGGGASERRGAQRRGASLAPLPAERPSELGTAASFRPPTARLRLGRPSDARSAERGEPMPARLRVRRRSLNAPRARRSVPGCLRRRRLQPADLPACVRATRGARSEEISLCSAPSSRDGVEGVFCVSEGARQSRVGRVPIPRLAPGWGCPYQFG